MTGHLCALYLASASHKGSSSRLEWDPREGPFSFLGAQNPGRTRSPWAEYAELADYEQQRRAKAKEGDVEPEERGIHPSHKHTQTHTSKPEECHNEVMIILLGFLG